MTEINVEIHLDDLVGRVVATTIAATLEAVGGDIDDIDTQEIVARVMADLEADPPSLRPGGADDQQRRS